MASRAARQAVGFIANYDELPPHRFPVRRSPKSVRQHDYRVGKPRFDGRPFKTVCRRRRIGDIPRNSLCDNVICVTDCRYVNYGEA
jgi:hypothetical protein